MLLAPGSPPMLRLDDAWRALQLSPLQAEDVISMAAAQLSPKPQGEKDGYAYCDFSYGDVRVAFYRAMAFGFPETRFLMVSRTPPSGPQPADSRFPNAGA
jgi:Tfp pilus assembly pilus retraction ATPase PilT